MDPFLCIHVTLSRADWSLFTHKAWHPDPRLVSKKVPVDRHILTEERDSFEANEFVTSKVILFAFYIAYSFLIHFATNTANLRTHIRVHACSLNITNASLSRNDTQPYQS